VAKKIQIFFFVTTGRRLNFRKIKSVSKGLQLSPSSYCDFRVNYYWRV